MHRIDGRRQRPYNCIGHQTADKKTMYLWTHCSIGRSIDEIIGANNIDVASNIGQQLSCLIFKLLLKLSIYVCQSMQDIHIPCRNPYCCLSARLHRMSTARTRPCRPCVCLVAHNKTHHRNHSSGPLCCAGNQRTCHLHPHRGCPETDQRWHYRHSCQSGCSRCKAGSQSHWSDLHDGKAWHCRGAGISHTKNEIGKCK